MDIIEESNAEVYSEEMIKKAKNELVESPISSELFLHQEFGVIARWEKNSDSPYVRSYENIPFSISLYTNNQLNYLKTLKNSSWEKPLVLSYDITGSVQNA